RARQPCGYRLPAELPSLRSRETEAALGDYHEIPRSMHADDRPQPPPPQVPKDRRGRSVAISNPVGGRGSRACAGGNATASRWPDRARSRGGTETFLRGGREQSLFFTRSALCHTGQSGLLRARLDRHGTERASCPAPTIQIDVGP